MVGVERAEPVAAAAIGSSGRWSASRCPAAGPSREVISSTGNSTPSSVPSARSVAPNPGTVSIRVMSRSKPTTSSTHVVRVRGRCPGVAPPALACDAGTSVPAHGAAPGPKGVLGWRLGASRDPSLATRPGRRAGRRRPAGPGRRRHDAELHLVTLDGPGHGWLPRPLSARVVPHDPAERPGRRCSAGVGAEPVYRWTTALNGFAAELTDDQASLLRSDPTVRLVEENAVRRLAGAPVSGSPAAPDRSRGGAGVVVGMVDTGIWPDSPLFASSGDLGASPRRFRGACRAGEDWDSATPATASWSGPGGSCDGFGAGPAAHLELPLPARRPRARHPVASIVAGNAGVSVQARGQRAAQYSGLAPQARLAVYKACWTAPDPADDGCATADLVTAIDRATRDRVDVLNLAVAGPPGLDTVERALLGAAEADVVVVGAAGNHGRTPYAAHPLPGCSRSAATTGALPRGRGRPGPGRDADRGHGVSRPVGPARLVLAARGRRPGATPERPGSARRGRLTPSAAAGAVVLCRRGGIGRVDEVGRGPPGRRGRDGARQHPSRHGRARPALRAHGPPRPVRSRRDPRPSTPTGRTPGSACARSGPSGPRPGSPLVRPAATRPRRWSSRTWSRPARACSAPCPPSVSRTRWDFASGTSAATAWTSGVAARLLARTTTGVPTGSARPWSPRPARSPAARRRCAVAPDGPRGTGRAPGPRLPGPARRLPRAGSTATSTAS